jgi:putative PD-(D/E)XK family protein DUF4420
MSSRGVPAERHLSIEGFDRYLRQNVPLDYPIEGEPRLVVFIDPGRPAIGLRIPHRTGGSLPKMSWEHIRIREVRRMDGYQAEVFITDRRLFVDAYPVLLAIADRVQVDGCSLETAISDTMRVLGRLLKHRNSLSVEQELGLFGELLLLSGLIRTVGADEAIQGWRGPQGEEHDFGLRGNDIEVKATNGERRVHWIGSLTQLQVVEERPLWIVSYQLTAAGPDDGLTLPQLIDSIWKRLATGSLREAFDHDLRIAGWDEEYESTSRMRWRRREKPIAFAVDDGFPQLTPDLLHKAGVNLTHLSDVRYRVDMTDLPSKAEVPGFLAAAIADGGRT